MLSDSSVRNRIAEGLGEQGHTFRPITPRQAMEGIAVAIVPAALLRCRKESSLGCLGIGVCSINNSHTGCGTKIGMTFKIMPLEVQCM